MVPRVGCRRQERSTAGGWVVAGAVMLSTLACDDEGLVGPKGGDGQPRVAPLCELAGVPSDQVPAIGTEVAFANLTFTNPILLTHAADGSDRIFVAEQGGRVWVFDNDDVVAPGEAQVFLDVSVDCCGEEGLLAGFG